MNQKQIDQHVPVLGILHLVSGALFAVSGIFIFVFLSGLGAVVQDPMAFRALTVIGFTTGSLLVVLALPGMAAGYGLLRRRPWGRALAIAVGVLNLINFPIGTVIGVYSLIVLLQTETSAFYVSPSQA